MTCPNGHHSSSSMAWSDFDPMARKYLTCNGRMHIKDASNWVNIGQVSVAIVEMMLFIAFYLIHWTDPDMETTFSTSFLVAGICFFVISLFFACLLQAGLRYENCGLIVSDLGWITISTVLRGLTIILVIIQLIHFPGSVAWLSAGLMAALVSFVVQCLSCYVLARCAYFMRHVRIHKRRTEALNAARIMMVQYWRPQNTHRNQHPPPPYTASTLNIVTLNENAQNNNAQSMIIEQANEEPKP